MDRIPTAYLRRYPRKEYRGTMATEPDLRTRLSKAIKSYEVGWKPVDGELYDLCRRRPRHDDFADVYTKVAMIGRVYAAGIARRWRPSRAGDRHGRG
jgi:hypothetical protein